MLDEGLKMFTKINDLAKLDPEVKAGVNAGTYRLFRWNWVKGAFVLLMGKKVFSLDSSGEFVGEVDEREIPQEAFSHSLAFVDTAPGGKLTSNLLPR